MQVTAASASLRFPLQSITRASARSALSPGRPGAFAERRDGASAHASSRRRYAPRSLAHRLVVAALRASPVSASPSSGFRTAPCTTRRTSVSARAMQPCPHRCGQLRHRLRQRAAHDCLRLRPHRPPLSRRDGSVPSGSQAFPHRCRRAFGRIPSGPRSRAAHRAKLRLSRPCGLRSLARVARLASPPIPSLAHGLAAPTPEGVLHFVPAASRWLHCARVTRPEWPATRPANHRRTLS